MVYWAMAVGQLILGVVSYVLISTGTLGTPDYSLAMTFQKIALIFIPLMMAAGYFLFKYQLSRVDLKIPLEDKLKRYFTLILVRGALFELAFFYCCVAALTTRVSLFLWIAPVVFFIFLLLRPTPEGITVDLQLSQNDSRKLAQQ
jgi:hypothetical protein